MLGVEGHRPHSTWKAEHADRKLIFAVPIRAAIARADRSLRVCMWTCPTVLIAGPAGTGPVTAIGLYRALEIVVGCLIVAAFHLLAERLLAPLQIVRE